MQFGGTVLMRPERREHDHLALRRQLFPALDGAYQRWIAAADGSAFEDLILRGATHWLELARRLVELHAEHADRSAKPIVRETEAAVL